MDYVTKSSRDILDLLKKIRQQKQSPHEKGYRDILEQSDDVGRQRTVPGLKRSFREIKEHRLETDILQLLYNLSRER